MQGISLIEVLISLFLLSLILLGVSSVNMDLVKETTSSWKEAVKQNQILNSKEFMSSHNQKGD